MCPVCTSFKTGQYIWWDDEVKTVVVLSWMELAIGRLLATLLRGVARISGMEVLRIVVQYSSTAQIFWAKPTN